MGLIASAMRADALLPPLLIFYMISLCDVFLGLTGIQFPSCGRNASHEAPPAQIRTCGITAYGSCLG